MNIDRLFDVMCYTSTSSSSPDMFLTVQELSASDRISLFPFLSLKTSSSSHILIPDPHPLTVL